SGAEEPTGAAPPAPEELGPPASGPTASGPAASGPPPPSTPAPESAGTPSPGGEAGAERAEREDRVDRADGAAATQGFPDRDQLVEAWGDHIIGRLRPKAKALFQAGRFMGASGDHARFGLPNEIHRVRCEELRPEVEGALADHFGCPIVLDLVVDPGAESPLPGPPGEGPTAAPPPERPSAAPAGTTTAPPGAGAGQAGRSRSGSPGPGSSGRGQGTGRQGAGRQATARRGAEPAPGHPVPGGTGE